MTKRFCATACALSLLLAAPAATLAEQRAGGTPGRQAPAQAPAPAVRAAAPVFRAAPVSRPAPVAQSAPGNAGGFNFNHDINARTAPVQRRITPVRQTTPQPNVVLQPTAPGRPITLQPIVRQQPGTQPQPPGRTGNPPVANFPHPPFANGNGVPNNRRSYGPVLRNSRAPNGTWGWNHHVAWNPAPVYWGGGFWGPYAIASLTGDVLFGSIVDYQDQLIYPSYQVEPESPGEQFLQDYGLQQTQCGPPDLVVIWGPNNSVICAFPDGSVAPGNYEVDPETFTLVPITQ
jgi:hypothetical protein